MDVILKIFKVFVYVIEFDIFTGGMYVYTCITVYYIYISYMLHNYTDTQTKFIHSQH